MDILTKNNSDISLFSCSDVYIAKYLDKNLDKNLISELDDDRLSKIITYTKSWSFILDSLGPRIRNVINMIDIYFIRKFVISNKKYYTFLDENNKNLLYKALHYGNEYIGYYISNKNIFYSDEKASDVIIKTHNSSNIIFVKDREENYLGICYLKHLINKNDELNSHIKHNFPKVESKLHTSDFIRYNHHYYIEAYPVIEDGKLIGALSNKGLNDLLEFEMDDDYYKLAGITENRLNTDNEHLGRKLPWLFVSLFTSFALSMMSMTFIDKIRQVPLLAFYLFMILLVSNGVAFQSVAASLSFLRKRNNTVISGLRLLYNEVKKSIIIGLVLSIISFVIIYFVTTIFKIDYFDNVYYNSDSIKFAADMTLILFVSVVASSYIAFVIPMIIDRFDYDYSIASSILISSITNIAITSLFFLFCYILF